MHATPETPQHTTMPMLLYANQLIINTGSRYAARTVNFIDFLAAIAQADEQCIVAVSTEPEPADATTLVTIDLQPKRVVELPAYHGHAAALLATFRQATKLKYAMPSGNAPRIVGGPGPNSMLWLLSLLMPRSTRFAFFIRGNTAQTLLHIYLRSVFRPIVVTLVRMFDRRIQKLQRQGRAVVFAIGPELVDKYDIGKGRTHCILPLLQVDAILESAPTRNSGGPVRLLCLGRLSAEKNIDSLVRAVAILKSKSIDIALTIAGAGNQQSPLKQLVIDLGLQNDVTFAGFVPHGPRVHQLLDEHDRLALCSFTEGVPRSVVEAFARWLPVIATRVGSMPRLFPDEITWANDTSPDEIASAIARSISHPDQARDMTAQAHAKLNAFRVDLEAVRVAAMLRNPAIWETVA